MWFPEADEIEIGTFDPKTGVGYASHKATADGNLNDGFDYEMRPIENSPPSAREAVVGEGKPLKLSLDCITTPTP